MAASASATRTWSWCIATLLSVLASTSTEAATDHDPLATARLEAELAERGRLYLRVDLERRELSVRCRGMLLERLPAERIELLAVAGGPTAPPTVLTVERGPYPRRRHFIEPGDAALPPREPAEHYRQFIAELSDGWRLTVNPSPDLSGRWSQLQLGLADAWRTLRGVHVERPPLLLVEMEQAERLNELLRSGDRILVVARSPWPAGWGELPPAAGTDDAEPRP